MAVREAARALARSMLRNEEGSIAILFALMLVPLLGITMIAIDYGRASNVEARLQAAADAAARAGALRLGQPHDLVREAVRLNLDENLPKSLKGVPFSLDIGLNDERLSLTISKAVPTSISGLFGANKIDVAVKSDAERPAPPASAPGSEGPGVETPGFGGSQPGGVGQGPALTGRAAIEDAIKQAAERAGVSEWDIREHQDEIRDAARMIDNIDPAELERMR